MHRGLRTGPRGNHMMDIHHLAVRALLAAALTGLAALLASTPLTVALT
jgi:hypothetical protein